MVRKWHIFFKARLYGCWHPTNIGAAAVPGLNKAVWLPVIWIAGCPVGQSRKNSPLRAGNLFIM
jgi:hypothetical protein